MASWFRLTCSRGIEARLSLRHTLTNGQAFGWRALNDSHTEYSGVLGDSLLLLRQVSADRVDVRIEYSAGAVDTGVATTLLRDYFHLDIDVVPLHARWAAADPRLASIAAALSGMRVLRQPPFECLISFICSSNNNIARISGMLARLREAFGRPIGDPPQAYAFPRVVDLAVVPESALRALGFGYRAAFVVDTAKAVQVGWRGVLCGCIIARTRSLPPPCTQALGGEAWLEGLRVTHGWRPDVDDAAAAASREAVASALQVLPGVGRKVADCVSVFALDQPGAVPVDTHVWAIACRYFDPSLRSARSLTPTVYARVGDLFRARFGPHAGWAHCFLFAAELPAFAALLPEAVVTEQAEVRAEARAAKTAVKDARKAAAAAREAAAACAGAAAGPADATVVALAEAVPVPLLAERASGRSGAQKRQRAKSGTGRTSSGDYLQAPADAEARGAVAQRRRPVRQQASPGLEGLLF